jgi:hypothetical protein
MRSGSTRSLSTLVAVLLCCTCNAGVAQALTAAAVLSDIHARGPYAVVQSLWGKPEWDDLLVKVETGQTDWLQVAVMIYPGTDAGSAEELTYAVGAALLHDPHQVLLRVAPVLGLEGICSAPDIDDPRWSTKQKAVANLDDRIAAVRRLSDPSVAAARASCLKYLHEDRALLLSPNSPYF